MNKHTLQRIMDESKVDDRRINSLSAFDLHNVAREYQTAYEWADAVEDTISKMEEQIKILQKVVRQLDCYDKAQGGVESAIYQIKLAIEEEERISAHFWAEKPEDFERR